jgi:hypothetical protein
MMHDTKTAILQALEPYQNTQHGEGRYNTPWRPDADGGTLAVSENDDGLLVWYDHKTEEGGSQRELADRLNIQTPNDTHPSGKIWERAGISQGATYAPKPAYTSLEDYATKHGVSKQVFSRAGWKETRRRGHKVLAIATQTGTRYRYLDEEKAGLKYDHEKGWKPCWYGLGVAISMQLDCLIICNGEASTVVAHHYGVPAICVPGGEKKIPQPLIEELQERWQGRIYVALDSDDKGRKVAPQIAEQVRGTAIDLGHDFGYDLADFCRDNPEDTLQALEKRARTGTVYTPSWIQEGITLFALRRKEFDELQWIVPGLLPEGCCLMAGKPKTKKSWLALGLSLAVAMQQRKAFDSLDTRSGEVLYLDLESNQRRMKSRVGAMLGDALEWPDNFHLFTSWERGEAGIQMLEEWMQYHPKTALIVVDILQNIRAPRDKNANPYDDDYNAVKPLNQFAERHRITVIVIHHTRKAKSTADDVFEEISGTTGLTGGVATMWIIGRVPGSDDMVLHIRGRDVDDEELALSWDDYATEHRVEGDAAVYAITSERQRVLEAMKEGVKYTPKDIAAELETTVNAVQKQLRHLADSLLVRKVGYGKYEKICRQSRQSGQSGNSRQSRHSAYGASTLPNSAWGGGRVGDASESDKTAFFGNSAYSACYSIGEKSQKEYIGDILSAHASGTLRITIDNGQYWLTDDQSHVIWPEPFASQADASNQVAQWLHESSSGYQSLEGY